MFARRVENHFGEWNPEQLSIFIKQPRDQLIDWRFCWVRRRSPMFLREAFRGAHTDGDKKRDAKHSLIQNPRWRLNKSKRTAVQPQSVLSPRGEDCAQTEKRKCYTAWTTHDEQIRENFCRRSSRSCGQRFNPPP